MLIHKTKHFPAGSATIRVPALFLSCATAQKAQIGLRLRVRDRVNDGE